MTDIILYKLYDVSLTPEGWTVRRFGNLERKGRSVSLGAHTSEEAANASVDADIVSGGWKTRRSQQVRA